ncbi:MAG: radical SAM family heme chaperone HemW [Lishizhenia sp.]
MAGIYIHIPFCKKACTYCDFHFSTTFEKYRTEMITSICKEIKVRKSYLHHKAVQTIYFGGGTPSLLNETELKQILNTIHSEFNVQKNAEITLEANPDDINNKELEKWKNFGVNRLSIGIQSFRASDLVWMNRAHQLEEAHNALRSAKNYGFELSLDLMYGLPHLSSEEWLHNIREALKYRPEHISAYCLTLEKNTVLDRKVDLGEISLPSNEAEAEQFLLLRAELEKDGYEHYEISNFARDRKYAKHNSNYWLGSSYLGVGPSAHSYNKVSRSWNSANNSNYIKGIKENTSVTETEILSKIDIFNETILIGLRTKWGVNLNLLSSDLVSLHHFQSELQNILQQENAYIKENHLILTDKGKAYADAIASQLFILD